MTEEFSNIKKMENFDIDSMPDLHIGVLAALERFVKDGVPSLKLNDYKRPLIVGSGNAAITGNLLFHDCDAIFANESNYKQKLNAVSSIDGGVLISASGSKHAINIAKYFKEKNMEFTLLTCNEEAPAKKFVEPENVFVYPKNREPYTYNISTYLGMILSKTKENPAKILEYIHEKLNLFINKDFSEYKSFFFIIPSEFDNIKEMFTTKFDELLQPAVSARVFTIEQTKHSKTMHENKEELFVSLGYKNDTFGCSDSRVNIPLPENTSYAGLMAIGYYIIGLIQAKHNQYFKKNITNYAKKSSEIFGQNIKPIVD